jgi:hypothetical protein
MGGDWLGLGDGLWGNLEWGEEEKRWEIGERFCKELGVRSKFEGAWQCGGRSGRGEDAGVRNDEDGADGEWVVVAGCLGLKNELVGRCESGSFFGRSDRLFGTWGWGSRARPPRKRGQCWCDRCDLVERPAYACQVV